MANKKDKGKIVIRRARLADALKIKNTHVASIRDICSKDYTAEQIEAWSGHRKSEHYRKTMKSGGIFYVASIGNRIAGFSCLLGNEIRAVYIHPLFLGKGLAKKLLTAVEKHARKNGIKTLKLDSTITALEFYKKHGYQIVKHPMHRMFRGVQVPCVRMKKNLA